MCTRAFVSIHIHVCVCVSVRPYDVHWTQYIKLKPMYTVRHSLSIRAYELNNKSADEEQIS